MKITKIKSLKNKTINTQALAKDLIKILSKQGFLVELKTSTSCSFEINYNRSSFRIDVRKLGHNLRPSDGPTGYKRTNVPTWEQRVKFNKIVQKFFSKNKLSAKIVSGNFLIREEDNNMEEYDWEDTQFQYGKSKIIPILKDYDQIEKTARRERVKELARKKLAEKPQSIQYILEKD